MRRVLAILALTILQAPAFAQSGDNALERSRWVLTMWNSAPETRERAPDLTFASGRVGGFAGCNGFTAAIESGPADDGGRPFRLREIGLTKMLCEGPPLHAEERYVAALRRVRRLTVAGDRLILTGERNLRLEYAARPLAR